MTVRSPGELAKFCEVHLNQAQACFQSFRRAIGRGDHASADAALMDALYELRLVRRLREAYRA